MQNAKNLHLQKNTTWKYLRRHLDVLHYFPSFVSEILIGDKNKIENGY